MAVDRRRFADDAGARQPLAGPRTMRWWAAHSDAWRAARTDPQPTERAIASFVEWVEHQDKTIGLPVLVAYPAAFDAMWVEWYCHRFAGASPFRRRAIDVKTLAMVAMGAGYRHTAKSALPRHWRAAAAHTHQALDDAIEQGRLFVNIVRELNVQRGDVTLAAEPPSTTSSDRRQRRRDRSRRRGG